MASTNKVRNTRQRATGKVKEIIGEVSGDDQLRDEGKDDQTLAKLKQAGEKVKDAFKR